MALSAIAMLSFVGYAFLEAYFFLGQWLPGTTAAAAETLVVVAIVGGWTWGLLAAAGSSRGGFVAMLVFSLIAALITLYDLVFYSPIPYGWPLLQIVVWTTFVINILAIALVAFQMKPKR